MDRSVLDPRLNAYRGDLAAAALRGQVETPRYAEGERRQVIEEAAPVRRAPRFDAILDTQALFGETLTVYDEREGWSWAQLDGDGYVGYVPTDALSAEIVPPTHRVRALRTYVFTAPERKVPPLRLLSLNAGLAVVDEADGFVRLHDGGFVFAAHAAPVGEVEADFVAVAERFLGTPYLWGGRTSIGIDCSGLVQLALVTSGVQAPRDSDMIEAALGTALPDPADLGALRRGDLLFWEGHMGVMLDEARLLHATAHHMATVIEPVGDTASRIVDLGRTITSIKRF